MFSRIVYEDSSAFFTVVAFAFAASIFITISWRAIRMRRPQVEHLENLPFLTPTPACVRDESQSRSAHAGSQTTSEDTPLH